MPLFLIIYAIIYLSRDLEGLVVAAILLSLLGHQTNVGHVTSALPVKLTVGNAVLNDSLQIKQDNKIHLVKMWQGCSTITEIPSM